MVKHNELNFTAIINPFHGPGTPPYPSAQYVNQVIRLNLAPNVKTLGYVNASILRSNKTVREEIATYEGWAKHTGLALSGIFFDQIPNTYVGGKRTREYLTNISTKVKRSSNFTENKMVVFSVGSIPNTNLTGIPSVDITVAFEGAYDNMSPYSDMRKDMTQVFGGRENIACIMHSVPSGISNVGLRKVINAVRRNVEYLLLTDLSENWGEAFGGIWWDFLGLTW